MFCCERCRAHHDRAPVLRSEAVCKMCGLNICDVNGCREPAIPGRIICDPHAYPAESKKSNRRQAIEAQKKAKALLALAEE